MNINRMFFGILVGVFLLNQSLLNGMFRQVGKVGLVLTGLYVVGKMYDEIYGKKLEFVDVGTLSKPIVVGQMLHNNDEEFVKSITRQQLASDFYLTNGPVFYAKRGLSQNYADIVDAVLFSHFWVFLPTLRQKLTNFVLHLSCDEVGQRERNRLCFLHGTNQGVAIMVRTIFDEVFNDVLHQDFVKLRDDSLVDSLDKYNDVHEYYEEQYPLAPREKLLIRSSPGGPTISVSEQILFDKGIAGDHTLCTNFGFFGQSRWLIDGRKESSAEFITESCSWGYQMINSLDGLLSLVSRNPMGLVSLVTDLVKNPYAIINLGTILDKKNKGYSDQLFLKNIFREYDIERYYGRYDKELQFMANISNKGLVHLFINEEQAKRYGYVSGGVGVRALSDPEEIRAIESINAHNLSSYQARVLMHSQICNSANTTMRFYLLGEPEKVRNTIGRIYEIAREIRAERQGYIVEQIAKNEQRQTLTE